MEKIQSVQIVKATTEEDLIQILALQSANHRSNLTEEERTMQGFVTLIYDLDFLRVMPAGNHHIIAKDGDKVVGYVMLMDRSSNHLMKEGAGIFPVFNELEYKGKKFKEINYCSVGQVCVHKDYAGQGLLSKMYAYYKACYKGVYDLAMTDISYLNHRSMKAHKKAGFEVVHRFDEPDQGEPWDIIVWDWRD
jgi:GNAT superfamily N-acetyltransferase